MKNLKLFLLSGLFATVHTLELRYDRPVKLFEFTSTMRKIINVWEHEAPLESNEFLLGQYITDEAVDDDEPPSDTFVAM